MISFMIQQVLFQNLSPKISEIGNVFYNFALPVKPGFTGNIGKPVLPVFYQFLPVQFLNPCPDNTDSGFLLQPPFFFRLRKSNAVTPPLQLQCSVLLARSPSLICPTAQKEIGFKGRDHHVSREMRSGGFVCRAASLGLPRA